MTHRPIPSAACSANSVSFGASAGVKGRFAANGKTRSGPNTCTCASHASAGRRSFGALGEGLKDGGASLMVGALLAEGALTRRGCREPARLCYGPGCASEERAPCNASEEVGQMATVEREPYAGVFPIAPTPFTDRFDLDLAGQRRVLDCMIDQGVDGICILANYSEQFVLTDAERDTLLDVCLAHVGGRVPVIVTCSHFSTRIAIERARRAEAAGARMLMLMPPYHGATLRADETGIFEHYARVAEVVSIPIMVQDAPLSGVPLSVPLLARLAREVPQVRYFKIEVPGAAAKLRALIAHAGAAVAGPFDGEEGITLMADLDAGATGTMPSALLPELIRPVLEQHRAGRHAEAGAAYTRILPLINYENRQCGLRAAKTVMAAGGVIKSDAVRHPLEPLHPATRAGLLALASELKLLALRWGDSA